MRRWRLLLLSVLSACQMEGVTDLHPAGPTLSSLEPMEAPAAGTVRIRGRGFRRDPTENLVRFGGVRARIRFASETVLDVEVPRCLPSTKLLVTVSVDGNPSEGLPLEVREGSPPAVPLALGESLRVPAGDGSECVKLSGGATYLALVHSAGFVAGARYGFSLLGLSPAHARRGPAFVGAALPARSRDPEGVWHTELRRLEARALTRISGRALAPGSTGSRGAAPPTIGEERRFNVLDAAGRTQNVRAVARVVSQRAAFYLDEEAPPGGLTDDDLRALGRDFDELAYPIVAGVFGEGSDIDGNQRVIVLLTPAVNRLTPPAASGFVGGFFFAVDLLPEAAGGNAGEVLYTLVPDPEGRFGSPRTREQVRAVLPPILAHELQHMVHFHQRMRVRGAPRNEAVWLSEALAQTAETLVADTLRRRGAVAQAVIYADPSLRRARDYLGDPGAVSLLITAGQGSLAERGAGWLFLRYLQGHHGGTQLLTSLTRTTLTGPDNIEAVTGRGWEDLLSDWSVANFADGLPGLPPGRFQYPDMDLRSELTLTGQSYPLRPLSLGSDFELEGARLAASSEYFLISASDPSPFALRLAAAGGGAPPPEARFILRVVRIQ